MMTSEGTRELIDHYISQGEMLIQNYLFADDSAVYTSVIFGIIACKTIYDLSRIVSPLYVKSYWSFSRSKQIEWNNRAMSTLHALFIATVSFYFVFWSDFFSDDMLRGPITLRCSPLSKFALGVSLGYFLSDIGMIFWFYPSLGGVEYIIHHLLSLVGVTYTMLTGEAQFYTFLVLVSEATTPSVNLRWYLDTAGMKSSTAYIINGVAMFVAWLVARVLLFVYLFYHAYKYHDQVEQMNLSGVLLVLVVPAVLGVMNLNWFWKIYKGLRKTLEKRD